MVTRHDALAEEPMDALDLRILSGLSALLPIADPMPPDLIDRINFNLTLAGLEAEVAELQKISLAAVRGEDTLRVDAEQVETITFGASSVSLMITVSRNEDSTGQRRVDGWVTGGGLRVELCQGAVRTAAESDSNGRLSWACVPAGSTRFLIQPASPGGRPVITPAVDL